MLFHFRIGMLQRNVATEGEIYRQETHSLMLIHLAR